ncbi:MAG: adenylate/guanylate cyclase domain-containing protein [Pseudomonadota bacterium]|nr:adenylate/guanylate cyclase domain-containing protein [Pseudomonadota bacterium]
MSDALQAYVPSIMWHMVMLGIGFAFIHADRDSPTSKALAAAFAFYGMECIPGVFLRALDHWPLPLEWRALLAIPGNLAYIAFAEWFRLVLLTAIPQGRLVRGGLLMLRLSQLMLASLVICAFALPELYGRDFLPPLVGGRGSGPGYWLFAGLGQAARFMLVLPILILLLQKIDFQERPRVLGLIAAIPLIDVLPYFLPIASPLFWASNILGLMIFLAGAVRYHVLQGQRGQFMARFLSPQVRSLIHERGLLRALDQTHLEITIVCCDLRGFTAYSQAHPPADVVRLLHDYYDSVGTVVAEFGATIKDFAGDGILILVGAPLPDSQHTRNALMLARRVHDAMRSVSQRWSHDAYRIGLGIGVASGKVIVGVIDSTSRFEYAAVGPAVNLAARLCAEAADGEILTDAQTLEAAGISASAFDTRAEMNLKGIAEPVIVVAVSA